MSNLMNMMEPLRAWWDAATMQTRAAAAGLGVLILAGLIFAATLAASPDYTVIFHGVPAKDAGAVETTLREHNIPMVFDDKALTVSVPSKDESEATMAVASAGILDKDKASASISGVSNAPFGMTDPTTQQENIRAANQARLAQILEGLEPISTAEVIIAPGNATDLFGKDVPPSASIKLGLKQGETLSNDQIKGIVNLVVMACTGMTSKNVAISDGTGNTLWDPESGDVSRTADNGAKADREYAQNLKMQLQDELSVFGLQNIRLTVNAHLDHDQTQVDSSRHGKGALVSHHEKDEGFFGGAAGAAGAGGATGVTPNTDPQSYGGGGSGPGGNYKSGESTDNYAPDDTHTMVVKGPGDVKFVSAAVLVNSTVPAASVDAIKNTVAGLIGASPGDHMHLFTVQQVAFDTSAQKAQAAEMKTLASTALWTNVAKFAAVSIAGCVLLFLLTRTGGRRAAGPQLAMAGDGANIGLLEGASDSELGSILEERPLRIEDVLAEMPDVADAPRSRRRRMHAPSIEEQQDLKLESIQDMIGSHPESVALLMKGWIAE